jgi:hypothetical protein
MAAIGNSCFWVVDISILWEAPMEGSVLSFLKTE